MPTGVTKNSFFGQLRTKLPSNYQINYIWLKILLTHCVRAQKDFLITAKQRALLRLLIKRPIKSKRV